MNKFEKGMAQLRKRLKKNAGVNIIVTDNSGNSVSLIQKSWTGVQAFRIEEDGRSRVEWSDKDFLIPVDELIIGGNLVEPEKGFRITQVFDNPVGTQVFEITAPNDEKPWRYSDPQNTVYRIHTKRVY